jgi:hypothetical protein
VHRWLPVANLRSGVPKAEGLEAFIALMWSLVRTTPEGPLALRDSSASPRLPLSVPIPRSGRRASFFSAAECQDEDVDLRPLPPPIVDEFWVDVLTIADACRDDDVLVLNASGFLLTGAECDRTRVSSN